MRSFTLEGGRVNRGGREDENNSSTKKDVLNWTVRKEEIGKTERLSEREREG